MAKIKEDIEKLFIKIPEWSMDVYTYVPTVAEIEAMAAHLRTNPEVAAAENAVDHAVVALIARTSEGVRHFEDEGIAAFSKRDPAIIQRVLSECGSLYGDVKSAIVKALGNKAPVKQLEEQNDGLTDKRTDTNG